MALIVRCRKVRVASLHMSLEILPQTRIDPRLVAFALCAEPAEHVSVEP